MDSILPVRKLFAQLRKLFWVWLAVAVLAGIITLLVFNATRDDRGQISQTVSFSYDGIESGNDPSGNRFDPAEIKDEAVVLAAVKAAGLDEEDLDIETIRDAITISGIVPDGVMGDITKLESVFEGDTISSTETIKTQSYFPTQYRVSLDYASAGLSGGQGAALLEQLLSSYETYFYDTYSFSGIEKAVRSLDYREYDYEDAVEVLDTKLSILRSFLSQQAKLDNSRYTSKETGYTFSDLVDAVDTIRNEDLMRVTSYVATYNLTKSKSERVNYFNYKIENEGRKQAQLQEILNTLDPLISGYKKTTAVVAGYLGSAAAGEGGETVLNYEVTQPSKTYDNLMDRQIEARTSLSESRERIARYQARLEQLESEESQGSVQVVEDVLAGADQKIDDLLTQAGKTTGEFYETVYLKRAFQVIPSSDSPLASLKSVVSGAMHKGIAVEGFLFFLYLLSAIVLALLANRQVQVARLEQFLEKTNPFRRGSGKAGKSGGNKNGDGKGR